MNNKILIQTALRLEFDAVKAFLSDIKPVAHPETQSMYIDGYYKSGHTVFEVLVAETGAGNARAADETSRAISFFKPDWTFFVGIAGGIKDVQLGDVVASTKVIGYEMGKADVSFKPRSDSAPASYKLEQMAKHVNRENKWSRKSKVQNSRTPNSFVQPIASGEKVIVSIRSTVYEYIKQYHSDAVAVDMEGNGFLIGARPYGAEAIEVRGVSDLLEQKEFADASGSQPVAAANAAAFVFEMLDEIGLHTTPTLQDEDYRKKLIDLLSNLYQQGPEQFDIWSRAGGDVSILVNATSRRAQWYSAIDTLAKGGGGRKISLETLSREVRVDYPNLDSELL
jgi:adenosylhomocysteine nucleosidase